MSIPNHPLLPSNTKLTSNLMEPEVILKISPLLMLITLVCFGCTASTPRPSMEDHCDSLFVEILAEDYFGGKGYIVPDTYKLNIVIDDLNKRFTPRLEEVWQAEQLLRQQGYNIDDKYQGFYRQYVGYVNNESERIVLMNLLNFADKQEVEYHYDYGCWTSELVIGFGGFYEENTIRYKANLAKNELTIF